MKKNKLKLTPWMIIKRGHYLYFLYYWLYGLIHDYKLAGKSLNHTVFNKQTDAFPVQCISYPYLKELLACVDFQEDEVFVDVGCAWGRLLGYLCLKTDIQQLVGVELNENVAEFAKRIFEDEPRVTILSGNILEKLPENGTTFYLFNPFGEEVLKEFLNVIEKKIKHPVRILYLHPTCRHVIETEGSGWILTEEKEVKPRCLGALRLCVYERKGGNEL